MFWMQIMFVALLTLAVLSQVTFIIYYWLMKRNEQVPVSVKLTRLQRLRHNGGKHTDKEWRALCAIYDYRCIRCGKRTELTKDHIVPVGQGGTDNISNIQPMCRPCNSSKGIKTINHRRPA